MSRTVSLKTRWGSHSQGSPQYRHHRISRRQPTAWLCTRQRAMPADRTALEPFCLSACFSTAHDLADLAPRVPTTACGLLKEPDKQESCKRPAENLPLVLRTAQHERRVALIRRSAENPAPKRAGAAKSSKTLANSHVKPKTSKTSSQPTTYRWHLVRFNVLFLNQ
jgi:hypothetical protein